VGKEKEKPHLLFLRRSGITARATIATGPHMLFSEPVLVSCSFIISSGLLPSTISSVHSCNHLL